MPEKTKLWYLKNINLLEGQEAILDIIGPGEVFDELALAADDEGEIYMEIAEALDDVLICAMSKNDFVDFLKKNPELNLRMLKLIDMKLRKVESKIEDLI